MSRKASSERSKHKNAIKLSKESKRKNNYARKRVSHVLYLNFSSVPDDDLLRPGQELNQQKVGMLVK